MRHGIQSDEQEYLEDRQPLGVHVYRHILKKVEHSSHKNSVLFKIFSVSHVKHIFILYLLELLK